MENNTSASLLIVDQPHHQHMLQVLLTSLFQLKYMVGTVQQMQRIKRKQGWVILFNLGRHLCSYPPSEQLIAKRTYIIKQITKCNQKYNQPLTTKAVKKLTVIINMDIPAKDEAETVNTYSW